MTNIIANYLLRFGFGMAVIGMILILLSLGVEMIVYCWKGF